MTATRYLVGVTWRRRPQHPKGPVRHAVRATSLQDIAECGARIHVHDERWLFDDQAPRACRACVATVRHQAAAERAAQ